MNTYTLQILQTDGENPPTLLGYSTYRAPAANANADEQAQDMAEEQAARFATKTGLSNIVGLSVKDE